MPTFPAGVAPAIWFDGNQTAFTDSGGTAVAAVNDLIRRVNEASPLTGHWSARSDAERPTHDTGAARLDLNVAAGGAALTRAAAGEITSKNSCTLVCSYLPRDNAYAGPQMGLFQIDSGVVGVRIGGTAVWDCAGLAFSSLQVRQAERCTIGIRYTPTSIDVWLLVGGDVVAKQSFAGSYASGAVSGNWLIGLNGATYLYGSVAQALAVNRQLNDTELGDTMGWAHAQSIPAAYPDDRALLVWCGDSIQRGTGASYEAIYPFLTLAAVRAAGYPAENCDVAVGGSGVPGLIDPAETSPNRNFLRRGAAFYSATRAHNVMVICLGTNDLANGNGPAFVLHGTGLGIPGSGLYPACDYARAIGFKVVLLPVGPRSNAMSVSQGQYNADRATVNASILGAEGRSHADAIVDLTQIVHWGFDGDSDNPTYYNSSDKTHPLNAGHALPAPAVTAAIFGLLAAPVTTPAPRRLGNAGGFALRDNSGRLLRTS